MKRIDINNKGKYPFTVREDDRVNSCHTVEIEVPCKIYHKDQSLKVSELCVKPFACSTDKGLFNTQISLYVDGGNLSRIFPYEAVRNPHMNQEQHFLPLDQNNRFSEKHKICLKPDSVCPSMVFNKEVNKN